MRAALAALSATVLLALLAAAAPAPAAARTVVKTRTGALGTHLVDGRGRTLYLFALDHTRRSRCHGACAQAWPPLIAHGRLRARGAVKRSRLSTSRRPGGVRQVVYAGHPLYRYAFDSAPGQTTGQGIDAFGARWWLVAPSGRRILSGAATQPTY